MIRCCQRQTFVNWELILVDDGSNNIEFEIVEKYIKDDERINLLKRNRAPKNGNTCRNIGVEMARGEYIMILDSDDLLSDNCFSQRVLFMDNHSSCDYASFPGRPFLYENELNNKPKSKICFGLERNRKTFEYNLISLCYPFTVWTNIYKRSSILNIKWDESVYIMQDLDWMLSCCFAGLKHEYAQNAEFDYFYRQYTSGSNVCSDFSSESKCRSIIYLCDKIQALVLNQGDLELNKAFRIFVLRQYQRILQGNNPNSMNLFLDSCIYLDSNTKNKLSSFAASFFRTFNENSPLKLYSFMFFRIDFSYYREFIHSFVNFIRGRALSFYK